MTTLYQTIESERRNARKVGYRPIPGWTWARIAEHRAAYEHPARLFPLVCARGVVAWGVPILPVSPQARIAAELAATAALRRGAGGDPIQRLEALWVLARARRIRQTGGTRPNSEHNDETEPFRVLRLRILARYYAAPRPVAREGCSPAACPETAVSWGRPGLE